MPKSISQLVRKTLSISVVLAASNLWLPPAYAHHAAQFKFDTTEIVTVSGTVAKVIFLNPHTILEVDEVSDDGSIIHWTVEAPGPPALKKYDWNRTTMSVGDEITVSGYQARDGSYRMYFSGIILANGKEIVIRK